MPISFQEDRATQVAARLTKLGGGTINHVKLIKLMYLVERTALVKHGRLVTFDWLISMRHGPVLSATLNCINDSVAPNESERSYWHRYISARENNEVSLVAEPLTDALSPAEVAIIDDTHARYGWMETWALVDWCHQHLPEWQDPGSSRLPIDLRAILASEHFIEEEIEEVMAAMDAEARLRQLTA